MKSANIDYYQHEFKECERKGGGGGRGAELSCLFICSKPLTDIDSFLSYHILHFEYFLNH